MRLLLRLHVLLDSLTKFLKLKLKHFIGEELLFLVVVLLLWRDLIEHLQLVKLVLEPLDLSQSIAAPAPIGQLLEAPSLAPQAPLRHATVAGAYAVALLFKHLFKILLSRSLI